MSRSRVVQGVLGSGAALFLLAACSAAVTTAPGGTTEPAPEGAPTSGGKTLAYIEGSVDGATHALTLTYRDPETGEILSEDDLSEGRGLKPDVVGCSSGATCAYGQTANHIYLHTGGTRGDGFSNGFASPPQYGTFANTYTAEMFAENGYPGTINNLTIYFDSVAPTGVGLWVFTGNPTTCNTGIGGAGSAPPCNASLGTTTPPTPGFPAPSISGSDVIVGFNDAINSGAGFFFSAHLVGN